jgi:phosphatidylglycerol:prolipoprotein diacylglycerol transferase
MSGILLRAEPSRNARTFPVPALPLFCRSVKPILFHFGDYALHSFGVMVALGFLAGLWVSARNVRRAGLNGDVVYDLAPWFVGGGLIGARLWYVISYWQQDFAGKPFSEVFALWHGGLVFYGGLILATLTGIWRVRRLGLPVWTMADCLAPGIVVGHAFGRLGCFLNGCCYGTATQLPWGVQFPADHVTKGATVHPTQLYEASLNLVFFAGLMWCFGRRKFPGQVFAVYLMGYAVLRSFTELFRGDYEVLSKPTAGILSPGQTMSLLILTLGIALFVTLRPKRDLTASAQS